MNVWGRLLRRRALERELDVELRDHISTYADLWRDSPFERQDRIAIMRTVDTQSGLGAPCRDDGG
jgi:hypothetical protein